MSITIAITSIMMPLQLRSYNNIHHHRHHVYHRHYSFDPITMTITIAITSITCIKDSIVQQCPSPPPSSLSFALQLKSYHNVNHHCHHVYHKPLQLQFYNNVHHPSSTPSRLSHALQLQSYNNVHHHRHHVYQMHYSFNPIKMSITSITIAITSITCITDSIL